jgi:hypothetical protein
MINDGGPAFPRTGADGHTSPQSGMALRDFFAAVALNGLMSKLEPERQLEHHIAKWSYEAADAMIRAREAKL